MPCYWRTNDYLIIFFAELSQACNAYANIKIIKIEEGTMRDQLII